MIYETTSGGGILLLILCVLVLWGMYRSEKKKEELQKKKEKQDQMALQRWWEERRRREEELDKEWEWIRSTGLTPVAVFLKEEEIGKKEYCEKASGNASITKRVIDLVWYAFDHADADERVRLKKLVEGRKGISTKFYLALDEEDVKKMRHSCLSTMLDESEVYLIGLELDYRQRLQEDSDQKCDLRKYSRRRF